MRSAMHCVTLILDQPLYQDYSGVCRFINVLGMETDAESPIADIANRL